MAKISGRQVNIGLGIEATAGTAVPATIFPKWDTFSLQAVAEKQMFESARGIRNKTSDSYIRRKYASGSVTVVPNVEIAPYLFGLALGSVSTTGPSDSAYEHTITPQNASASMKTATFLAEQGGTQTNRFANVVVDALNLDVSDGYAMLTAEMIGQYPDTSSITESFTEETEFAYHQYTVKFGTSISNAEGQSATPLKSFSLNIANSVLLDEAFLSGSNGIAAGGLCAGDLVITGSYSLHFSDTTELNKYLANTKNAAVIQFLGATIGGAEQEEIRIDLAKLVLTNPPIEYTKDGLIILTQQFEVEYGSTDSDITVIITNEQDGTDY